MEVFGPIIALLVAMPILAAIGVTTLAAFAFMSVLGLLTDMSFKRLFFVSFAMGLAALVLIAGMVFSTFDDPGFQRDLRDGFDQIVQIPDDPSDAATVGPLIPRLRNLRDDIENGDLSDKEIERRIEGLFEDTERGVVDIDGSQLSQDGDTVQITID